MSQSSQSSQIFDQIVELSASRDLISAGRFVSHRKEGQGWVGRHALRMTSVHEAHEAHEAIN